MNRQKLGFIILNLSWQTLLQLGSNHLPILLTLSISIAEDTPFAPRKTFIKSKKAHSNSLINVIDDLAKGPLQHDVNAARRTFRDAARHYIPAGRHRFFIPALKE